MRTHIGRVVVVVIGAAGLVACSNTQFLKHDKKEIDSPEYRVDVSECKLYADSAAPFVIVPGHGSERNLDEWTRYYYGCMIDKGWYVVDKNGNRIKMGAGKSDAASDSDMEIEITPFDQLHAK